MLRSGVRVYQHDWPGTVSAERVPSCLSVEYGKKMSQHVVDEQEQQELLEQHWGEGAATQHQERQPGIEAEMTPEPLEEDPQDPGRR